MEKPDQLNQTKAEVLFGKAKVILSEALGLALLGLAAVFAEELKNSCLAVLKDKLSGITQSEE